MELCVTLQTYWGKKGGWLNAVKRRLPLIECHPMTCSFNVEPKKDAKKLFSVKASLVYPTGVKSGTGILAQPEFHEHDLSEGAKEYLWTIIPPISGTCRLELSFKDLSNEDRLMDEFGGNKVDRDSEHNRFYSRLIRVYSLQEILLLVFATVSTISTAISTYLAWKLSTIPIND